MKKILVLTILFLTMTSANCKIIIEQLPEVEHQNLDGTPYYPNNDYSYNEPDATESYNENYYTYNSPESTSYGQNAPKYYSSNEEIVVEKPMPKNFYQGKRAQNSDIYNKKPTIKERFRNLMYGAMTGYSPSVTGYDSYYNNSYLPNYNYNSQYGNWGYNGGNFGHNPYNAPNLSQNYSPYYTMQQSPNYYTNQRNTRWFDLFGGGGGSDMYYDNGEYRKNYTNQGGGVGVTILD